MYSKSLNIAYKADGSVWAWGQNNLGQLGNNTSGSDVASPVQVVGSHKFYAVDSGITNSIGLKQDGAAWTWGYGTGIGDNTTNQRNSPVAVVGNHSFVECCSEWGFCLALKSNGAAWGWGSNADGNLGNNSTSDTVSPIQVVGNHSFIKIQCGGAWSPAQRTSGALKADGSMWGWGYNGYGILGDATTNSRSSPVTVVGNHSFVDFAVGRYERYGLKADGSVWSWGYNGNGSLGNNSITNSTSPVQVVGSHSFIKIALGCRSDGSSGTTCAGLKSDGTVWTWGYGVALGNNQTTNVSSPVQVVGGHSFVDITGGAGPYIAGLKANGSIWSWGNNATGQLGTNNTTNTSSPVQVVGSHSFIALYTGLRMSVNVAGNWKSNPIAFVNVSGTWKRVLSHKINASGAWCRTV